MKKLLPAFLILCFLVLTGCSETKSVAKKNDVNAILEKFHDDLSTKAQEDDFEGFKKLFSSDIPESLVTQYFNRIQTEEGKFEDKEIGVMYQTDDVIAGQVYKYTNLSSGNNTQSTNSTDILYLEKLDGKWKMSQSEKVMEAHKSKFIPILNKKYGEEFVTNGYVSGTYTVFFEKVLSNNVQVDTNKAKVNDDGSVDVYITISNGLDKDIFNIWFDELILKYSDQEIPYADLSGYELDASQIIYSKKQLTIPITLQKEDLLVDPSELDLSTSLGIGSSINYKERDK